MKTEAKLTDLTARDFYAGMALAGLAQIAHELPSKLVRRAFELADLALKAREEKPVSD